jgi:hypothetical protein
MNSLGYFEPPSGGGVLISLPYVDGGPSPTSSVVMLTIFEASEA